MQRSVEITVGFELLEERQHAIPRPAERAALHPVRIVRRQAAQRRHAVDRRRAADHPALVVEAARPGVRRVARPRGELGRAVRPDEARIGVGAGAINIEDFRRLLAGRVVRARLNQQDAVTVVLGEPRRQHAAGRAGTDHDEVVWILLNHHPRPLARADTSAWLAAVERRARSVSAARRPRSTLAVWEKRSRPTPWAAMVRKRLTLNRAAVPAPRLPAPSIDGRRRA